MIRGKTPGRFLRSFKIDFKPRKISLSNSDLLREEPRKTGKIPKRNKENLNRARALAKLNLPHPREAVFTQSSNSVWDKTTDRKWGRKQSR